MVGMLVQRVKIIFAGRMTAQLSATAAKTLMTLPCVQRWTQSHDESRRGARSKEARLRVRRRRRKRASARGRRGAVAGRRGRRIGSRAQSAGGICAMKKPKLNVKLLRKVAAHIKAEPSRYVQYDWVRPDSDSPCGTQACI